MNYQFTPEDKREFAEVLWALGVVYDKAVTEELAAAYELVLHDVPIVILKALAKQHIRTKKWFPRPCELIPQADYVAAWEQKLLASRKRSLEDERARLAWQRSPPMKIEYKPAGGVLSDLSGQE